MDVIQSPIGRVSWPFVFGEGDPEEKFSKYKLTLMLPKNAEALKSLGLNAKQAKALLQQVEQFVKKLRAEAKQLAKDKFKKSAASTRWNPILDGDEKAENWEGNANFWLIRMKTKFKPKVAKPKASDGYIVDGDEDEKDGFYPGCWARVACSLYTYDNQGNRGVAVGLGAIQKAYNDEPFSSEGFKFEDDIEDLDIDESDVEDFGDDEDEGFDEFDD